MNTDKIYAEKIANEYAVKEDSKVVALKKLDAKAKRGANIFAYIFGIVGALVLGTGMCFAMKVLGDGSTLYMVLGCVVGCLGILMCGINYPIYRKLIENGKKKYGADIIALAEQIAKEENE